MNIGKFPKEFRRVAKRPGVATESREGEERRKPAADRDDVAHAAALEHSGNFEKLLRNR